MLRIGYYFPEKKLKKQRIADFIDYANSHGLQMIQLDLSQDLGSQGPFDLILHKVTDLYTSDKPAERQQFDNLRNFLSANQTLPQIDPLSSVLALTNRVAVLAALRHVADTLGSPGLFRVPHSVVLEDGQRPDLAALKFPIVTKHPIACGFPETHHIGVFFSKEEATSLAGPLLIQEYIDHGTSMLKVYVIDGSIYLDTRTSLPLQPGEKKSAVFDSQNLSKDKPPASETVLLDNVSHETLRAIAVALGKHLDLTLFGYDLIVEKETGHYFVIDVNYFPAYGGVDEFFSRLLALIQKKAHKT